MLFVKGDDKVLVKLFVEFFESKIREARRTCFVVDIIGRSSATEVRGDEQLYTITEEQL